MTDRNSEETRRAHRRRASRQITPELPVILSSRSSIASNSDEEDDENLPTRPNFKDTTPHGENKAITLEGGGVIPACIALWLRPYQVDGAKYLWSLQQRRAGGLLGDEMGLGKTIQVIAYLTALFGKRGNTRDQYRMRKYREERKPYPIVMIVCPGSLISNWSRELNTWGWWRVMTYHGQDKADAYAAAVAGRTEVLITTYTTYKMNCEELNLIHWDAVIADECHIIKEMKSQVNQAMMKLNTDCRIGLSGTVIQNKYEELYHLLNWTNPGSLDTLDQWNRRISEPLKMGQRHDASNAELARARAIAVQLKNNLLPRYMLRRTKDLIAHQLPKKVDRVVFCPPSKIQAQGIQNFMASDWLQMILNSSERDEEDLELSSDDELREAQKPMHGLAAIVQMQKMANHMALLVPTFGRSEFEPKYESELKILKICFPETWQMYMNRSAELNFADIELCGKWKTLEKLLQHWYSEGCKVLIFSYSTRLLKMLDALMVQKEYLYCYLDGSLELEHRQQAVDEFNENPHQFVFLISTKAGGVGLNITSANRVVVFDPNFNPAHDMQAQDRAYRIGQRRDVEVYRLICAESIEENIYARQIYKQQMAAIGYEASVQRRYFSGVQGKQHGELFGLKNLLTLKAKQLKNIVRDTNIAEQSYEIANLNPEQIVRNDADPVDQLLHLQEKTANEGGSDGPVDPVMAILKDAGVQYMHSNKEVLQSSAIEARISAVAMQEEKNSLVGKLSAYGKPQIGMQFKIGKTPIDIRRRQLCSMARFLKYTSVEEFSLEVEKADSKTRHAMLQQFYEARRQMLNIEQ